MDNDFNNNNFDNKPKDHPDYYQPTSGNQTNENQQVNSPNVDNNSSQGSFNSQPAPKAPQEPSSTYHYSRSDIKQDAPNQSTGSSPYQSQSNNSQQGAPYTPPFTPPTQSTNQGAPYQPQGGMPTPDGNSPKGGKNKTIIAIVVVLAICIIIAIVGIVVSVTGKSDSSKSEKESTTASSSYDEAQPQDSQDVPTEDKDGNLTVAGVAANCKASCVGISVYSSQSNAYGDFYGYGQSNGSSQGSDKSEAGEGSGVIMNEHNGKTYIMTCAHVISDGSSFKVTTDDGKEYDASLVSFDSQTDIGVLSIDKTGLQVAEFADSDKVSVGEQVVAIGCPGGLEFMNSITSGYISAVDRPVASSIGYDNKCIQTDAAINPGNSGGALFNMQGQVIGINSSKIASTEYEGMGFAVPSTTALSTANSLIKSGYVEGRAKIGIQYSPITNYQNASSIVSALAEKGFKDCTGAMVIDSIDSTSDLNGKDVKQYDMIVAVNGKTMTSTDIMTSILADSKPGDTVKLTIARIENNEIKTFEVDCKLIESKGN